MTSAAASAPGKVVLAGEYAVLDGAPAIAMAVTCRARVSLESHEGQDHIIEAAGSVTPGDFVLFDSVERLYPARGPLRVRLDTREFVDSETNTKLGVGSSAALVVALTSALSPGDADDIQNFETARAAHRDFQQGRGSGVDIAASTAGGLLSYRMNDAGPTSLPWPQELRFALLWSGVAAGTGERIDRMLAGGKSRARTDLAAAATSIAGTWSSGDGASVVEAYRDYISALEKFSVDHDLGIFEAGHGNLTRKANRESMVYKPCGAGGGDVGIVLGTDERAVAEFAANAAADGFRRLELTIDATGVSKHE